MKLSKIYDLLDKLSPFELQEKWDNSGLMVGDSSQDIDKIVLSIDIDEALIESLDKGTLLITHHPIIFGGLKEIDFAKYPANLVQKMIKKDIANISMHTNFDKTHLNDFVVSEILGYDIVEKDGFVAYMDVNESFDIFVSKVTKAFNLKQTKVVKCSDMLGRVALTTGSGCSLIDTIKADCFLTGDIKYHDAMQAKSLNLSLIDIGHYESEHFFAQILQNHLKNLGLEVIISSSENPFTYI
ncbi:MAG: Nif3-like dinuclear metal center hexameric protein [Campylobacterales bacterium]